MDRDFRNTKKSPKLTFGLDSDPALQRDLRGVVIATTGSIRNQSRYITRVLRENVDRQNERLAEGIFGQIPESVSKHKTRIYEKAKELANARLVLAKDYIPSIVQDDFLSAYNRFRKKELSLESDIRSFADRHRLDSEQIYYLRVQLVNGRYDYYLGK
jgi:hypothetical protein